MRQGQNTTPITVKEVLKAIFIPAEDGESLPMPSISMPKIQIEEQSGEESSVAILTEEELNAPVELIYNLDDIVPIDNAPMKQIILLGGGTILTVMAGFIAQTMIATPGEGGGGFLLYLPAMVLWVALILMEFATPDGGLLRRGPSVTGAGAARTLDMISEVAFNTRVIIGLLALGFGVLTYFLTADNTFTPSGVLTWLISIVGVLVAFSERSPDELVDSLLDWFANLKMPSINLERDKLIRIGVVVGIMLLAAGLRFYQLDAIPNEMTSDHVEKLRDAYAVTQGTRNVFFLGNGGREAIQFYLVALVSKLPGIGISFKALKLVSVVESLLLIPLMFVLGKELVDRETGTYAAGLVAISWWHIMLGRLALRIVLTPLIFALVMIVLIRGVRTGARRSWLWAGVWLGVGVYSYQAMRIAPFVAVAAFIVAIAGPVIRMIRARLANRPEADQLGVIAGNIVQRQGVNLVAAGVVALIIFVPMLRVWHDYPAELWNRVLNRTTESEVAIAGSSMAVFVDNSFDALRMFNVEGDSSWFSAVLGAPMLDRVTGALFVIGLLAWLMRLRVRRDPVDVFILLAGLIMLLPSTLAIAFPLENPSATRGSGILPLVFIIAGWSLALIRQRWAAVMGQQMGNVLAGALILIVGISAGLFNFTTYYQGYAASYSRSALNPGEVARSVREVIGEDGSLDGVWLQGWPYWHDYRAIGIEAGDITFGNAIIDAMTLEQYLRDFPERFEVRPLVVIVHPLDVGALGILQSNFPEGEVQRYSSVTEGRDYVLYVVGE